MTAGLLLWLGGFLMGFATRGIVMALLDSRD